jgi:hypothetical protein
MRCFCHGHWQKVAKIIGKTLDTFEERGVRLTTKEIDARMEVLVGSRQLESEGNIRNWRYSEVRLPAAVQQA